MKKTSFFRNRTLIQTVLIFILCIGLVPVKMAQADAAPPPDPTVGGVGPYRPIKTNVQMMSETVFIDVPPSPSNVQELKQIKVNASFTMRNQGQAEEQMQVIFPLSRLGHDGSSEQALYLVDLSSFVAKVDGRPVPITQITTEPEVSADGTIQGFYPEVLWAAFDVSFPVNRNVLLQVEYEMINKFGEYGEGFTGISYILETGAGWYGNILSADITLRLPYSITDEIIRDANPGYVISGNKMRWNLKNFEPTREDNLEVSVIHVDAWQAILELRAKVAQNPKDADSWAELGDQYFRQGIHTREGYFVWSDPHFAQLASEARQKTVTLRPEWGDAHCKFAEILWFGNPGVQKMFSIGGGTTTAPDPHLDDPAIRQVIDELQQAWTYGTEECFDTNIYWYLKQVFPELELTLPVTVTITATTAPPTETLAPAATNTPLPTSTLTASPTLTLVPTVSPTLVPTETSSTTTLHTGLLSIVVGLALMIGTFIYQQKSKPNSMK